MAPSATVVVLTPSKLMQNLAVVGLISIGCVAFIGMMYGEMLLLNRK